MNTASAAGATAAGKHVSVKNLPVNLFGSVMGLAGLSLAWRLAHDAYGTSAAIADTIGVIAILAFIAIGLGYLAKWGKYPQAVRAEFEHPIAGNFFGTITIAILLLSAVIGNYSAMLQQVIWTIGAISTIVLSFIIVSRLLRGNVDGGHAVPAWLIPGVATLDIAVAGGTMPMVWAAELNLFSAAVGAVVALVFFTLIFARLVHKEALPAGMVPSLMILIAPFEVGFLAYVNIVQKVDMFAALLFYFGLFMFVVLAFKVFRPSVPFAPAWWAISFPIAALANAALKYAAVSGTWVLSLIAAVILFILSVAIAVLFVRTLHILFNGKLLAG
ncbi:SLAC1 anion channel family protein [Noviherbaspirillum sp.]|uniref:SLAC1 anion channel family protein n=1 Tax=Noviherbaspirillum sp. TaxID=1926288 RepID=UPI002D4B2DB0|nr:SLAC1 anion channel family protein [Noviherbaspirillum sp.]HZW19740.1 SLAC1 anion channel family protein [Noviherbaspirillum sp.]